MTPKFDANQTMKNILQVNKWIISHWQNQGGKCKFLYINKLSLIFWIKCTHNSVGDLKKLLRSREFLFKQIESADIWQVIVCY